MDYREQRKQDLEQVMDALLVPINKYSSKVSYTPKHKKFYRRIKQRFARYESEYYRLTGEYYRIDDIDRKV